MTCEYCRNRRICRVANLMQELGIIAEIRTCLYYAALGQQKNQADGSSQIPVHRRSIAEVMDIAKRIKTVNDAEKAREEEEAQGICSSCGKETAVAVCSICGKNVCYDCATTSATGGTYCPDCYENQQETPKIGGISLSELRKHMPDA